MRKIIVTMWVTLDGYIAGPNGEMDWIGEIYDEAMGNYEYDLVSSADTLLLGRVTYQSFAGSWPYVPDNPKAPEGEKEYARKLNAMRKIGPDDKRVARAIVAVVSKGPALTRANSAQAILRVAHIRLEEVKHGEQENPDQIHEVPE